MKHEISLSFALASRPEHARQIPHSSAASHKQAAPVPVPVQSAETTAVAEPVAAVPAVAPEPAAMTTTEPDYKAAYLNNPPPAYPLAARRMGLQGRVVLHVEVLASGLCGKISIQKSSGYAMLDTAALETVKSWHFLPARQTGNVIDKWFMIPLQFSLKDNAA